MKKQINFFKFQPAVCVVTIVIVIVGLWSIFGPSKLNLGFITPKNFNLGIDFQGGLSQVVTVYSGLSIEEMREMSGESGLGYDVQEIIIQERNKIGNASSFIIKTIITSEEQSYIAEKQKETAEFTAARFLQEKTDVLFSKIAERYGSEYILKGDAFNKALSYKAAGNIYSGELEVFEDNIILQNVVRESANTISPAYSSKMRTDAVFLILFVLVVILLYISWRFKVEYAIGSVIALVHDTFVMLAIISLTGTEIDLTVVAAILTIIGYSINDTIVIFDRIRENYAIMKDSHPDNIFNVSINQTLNRTIMTSATTLVSVLALYIFGGTKINAFSFTLLIGVIVGTYSSIFIAGPLVLFFDKAFGKNKAKYKKIEERAAKEESKAEENTDLESASAEDEGAVSKKTLLKLQGKKKK